MGHRHKSAPNRGSLGFRPRKRVKRESARWRAYPEWTDKADPNVLGFAGYKVGMTHIIKQEEKIRAPKFKQEVLTAVTIIELPKTLCFGLRLLKVGDTGILQVLGEVWYTNVDKDFKKKLKPPKKLDEKDFNKKLDDLKSQVDKAIEVRLLLYTVPREAGLPKKTPDIIETKIAGKDLQANFDYGASLLGKEIKFPDVFNEGEYVDITAVTIGKGFQGPVKRHGIKILPRKKRKGRRVVGAIGSWHPARTPWTTPRAGQLGYHQRTEFNKKVLKYSENPREINPKGGFKHFGVVKSSYVLIEGSIPGPSKRLIRLRKAMLKPKDKYPEAQDVKIAYISTSFRQRDSEQEEGL
ncbi:MAG: 50S ribosomal protein L3 [Candidatus Heimdallarchaeota archaeon LC_3]|nr:MAG: 50S ribosomal protein L3 [Candidatus Heimdallarchaeota archaeon LC_3]